MKEPEEDCYYWVYDESGCCGMEYTWEDVEKWIERDPCVDLVSKEAFDNRVDNWDYVVCYPKDFRGYKNV